MASRRRAQTGRASTPARPGQHGRRGGEALATRLPVTSAHRGAITKRNCRALAASTPGGLIPLRGRWASCPGSADCACPGARTSGWRTRPSACHARRSMTALGFGQPSGSAFPGEPSGLLSGYLQWRPAASAAISHGYGIAVTPPQLAPAHATRGSTGVARPISFQRDTTPPGGVPRLFNVARGAREAIAASAPAHALPAEAPLLSAQSPS
jgi:hypothetical protein